MVPDNEFGNQRERATLRCDDDGGGDGDGDHADDGKHAEHAARGRDSPPVFSGPRLLVFCS